MTCRHLHGARVPILAPWVCGQCFARLDDRPKRYSHVTSIRGNDGPPQVLEWMADERKSEDGLTLADFLRTMAKRYQFRCRDQIPDDIAYGIALDFLKAVGEEFGDPALDWSHQGAREMADEDMTYWEQDEEVSNG